MLTIDSTLSFVTTEAIMKLFISMIIERIRLFLNILLINNKFNVYQKL